MIIQYGYESDRIGMDSSIYTLTLPLSYTTVCIPLISGRPADHEDKYGHIVLVTKTRSLTKIVVANNGWTQSNYNGVTFDYMTIGY